MKISKKMLGTVALATLGAIGLSTEASASEVTVKAGDTLSQIAEENGTTVDTLVQLNQIENQHLIYVGDIIQTTGGEAVATVSEVSNVPVAQEEAYVAPVAEPVAEQAVESSAVGYSGDSSSAKEWIAQKESSGSYGATNGKYIGRYQLDASYLNGDYSPENQERVADRYVAERYGSWEAAQSFWLANNWY